MTVITCVIYKIKINRNTFSHVKVYETKILFGKHLSCHSYFLAITKVN